MSESDDNGYKAMENRKDHQKFKIRNFQKSIAMNNLFFDKNLHQPFAAAK